MIQLVFPTHFKRLLLLQVWISFYLKLHTVTLTGTIIQLSDSLQIIKTRYLQNVYFPGVFRQFQYCLPRCINAMRVVPEIWNQRVIQLLPEQGAAFFVLQNKNPVSLWLHFCNSGKNFFSLKTDYYERHLARTALQTGVRLLHLQLISANLCGIRVLFVTKNILCRTFTFLTAHFFLSSTGHNMAYNEISLQQILIYHRSNCVHIA